MSPLILLTPLVLSIFQPISIVARYSPDGYVDPRRSVFQLSIGWMVIRSVGQKVCICREQDFVSCSFPFFLLLDSKSTLIIWCSMILATT